MRLIANGETVADVAWFGFEDYRPTAVILIGCSLALLWMSQTVYKAVPAAETITLFILTAVAITAFFAGGRLAVKQGFDDWVRFLLSRPCRFFEVTAAQLVLIFFAVCFSVMARLAAGDFLVARHSLVSVLAWIVACVLGLFGSYPLWRNGAFYFGKKVNITRIDWLFFTILFLGAFVLRATLVGQIPNTFSGDEGSVGLFATQFLDGRANNLFTGGWFSFPSLYFAFVGATIGLFGQTVEAARLLSAFGGSLAVLGTYFLGRSLFDRPTAVIASLLLAASHYHIHMSRLALNNIWDSVFIAFAIAGLWYGWQRNERIGFVIAGFALGLGQYFYVTMRIVPVLFLVWALIAWWRQPTRFKARLAGLVLTAVLACIVFLPLAIYFASHLPEFNAPLNRVTIIGPRLAQLSEITGMSEPVIVFWQMVTAALGYTHEPLKLLYNPGVPLLLSGAATLFLLGIIWGLLRFDLRYLLLFLPLISVVITSGLSQDPPASQRFVLTMPIVVIFVAIPIRLLFNWLRRMWPAYKSLAAFATAVIVVWLAFLDISYYFTAINNTYIYAGFNTEVATEIGYYLREHEVQGQKVYFFGFPRMGYFSLSTIPYLAPTMLGEDVVDVLREPPTWAILKPTLFLFLPERNAELDFVRQSYPEGDYHEFKNNEGESLFSVYEVQPSEE